MALPSQAQKPNLSASSEAGLSGSGGYRVISRAAASRNGSRRKAAFSYSGAGQASITGPPEAPSRMDGDDAFEPNLAGMGKDLAPVDLKTLAELDVAAGDDLLQRRLALE